VKPNQLKEKLLRSYKYVNGIILFEADGCYVKMVRINNKSALITCRLAAVETCLVNDNFFRANRKMLININQVKECQLYFKGHEKHYKVKMKNNMFVKIAKRNYVSWQAHKIKLTLIYIPPKKFQHQ
jgi:DNA-binding LytR/AlgR family response regulator